MISFFQDLRHAATVMRKSPGFTAAAVLTLGLGIGATTTMFSVMNGVLLKPLPYPEAQRLVMVWETGEIVRAAMGFTEVPVSPGMAGEYQRQSTSFESLGIFASRMANLTGGGEAERVRGARVTPDLFATLRVKPALGRGFLPEEDTAGKDAVVVLSNGLWQRKFGGSPDALGKTLRIDDREYAIVGVMPEGFEFPRGNEHPKRPIVAEKTEFWRPMPIQAGERSNYGNHSFGIVARLKPGVTLERAQSELQAIEKRVVARVGQGKPEDWSVQLTPYLENMVQRSRPALMMLSLAVLMVLLIACVNVAGLLLVQSIARRREMALRAALGATPARLTAQVLAESVLLSVLGCAAGCLLTFWGVHAMRGLAGVKLPRMDQVGVDWTVMLFATAVSVVTGILFGLAPAAGAARVDLVETLKEGGRGGTSKGHHRIRTSLVVVEVALSMVLLTGAGLLVRSFVKVLEAEKGFDTANIVTMNIPLPAYRFPKSEQKVAFCRRALDEVEGLPGVQRAGVISRIPLSGSYDINTVVVEGRPKGKSGETPIAEFREISESYFDTMGVPLKAGRMTTRSDGPESQLVVVVSQAMATKLWPGQDPIGKRIKRGDREDIPWLTVVGVVGDVRQAEIEESPRPQAYVPMEQAGIYDMALVIRTSGDTGTMASAARQAIRRIDPDQPVLQIRTMEQCLEDSMAARKLQTVLIGGFALFALVLAAVGLNGVIAYSVSQRMKEFGIRVALGAQRGSILRNIVGHGLALAAVGVAVGGAAALALGKLVAGFLYGVKPADVVTLAGVAVALLVCAASATLAPARRAMKVDPMEALREQ